MTSVGGYSSRPAADEHALVILAMQLPCWIMAEGENHYLLAVESDKAEAATAELEAYRHDLLAEKREIHRVLPTFPARPWYAALYALILIVCFEYQTRHPEFKEQGIADSTAIVEAGEWHRAGTALLLHGDYDHLISNLLYGVVFGLLVAGSIGAKIGWLLIAVSGFLGNLINAYHYHLGEFPHKSLGASTAVFGGIGILAGCGLVAAFLSPKSAPWARAILPVAGGIAIIGWLGFGSAKVDAMAHIYGFVAGFPLGMIAAGWRILAANRHLGDEPRAPESL